MKSSIRFDSVKDKGGKEVNQDDVGHLYTDEKTAFFVLADGLGGHKGGEFASRFCVKSILEKVKGKFELSGDCLIKMLNAVNASLLLHQEQNPEFSDMKTTVVFFAIQGKKAIFCNIGDSRFYHFRNGDLHKKSRDHSIPQMLIDSGEITEDEVRGHPDRNKLTAVLGSKKFKAENYVFQEAFELTKNDHFLLCSDGFWEKLTDDEMRLFLRSSKSPDGWLEDMVDIIKVSLMEGDDNYSAIVVGYAG